MSVDAMNWAIGVDGVPGPAKSVLMVLAWRHNEKTGRCNPSITQLSADTGFCRRSVIAAVARLESAGLIRGSRSDGRVTNYILACCVSLEPEAPPEPEPTEAAPELIAMYTPPEWVAEELRTVDPELVESELAVFRIQANDTGMDPAATETWRAFCRQVRRAALFQVGRQRRQSEPIPDGWQPAADVLAMLPDGSAALVPEFVVRNKASGWRSLSWDAEFMRYVRTAGPGAGRSARAPDQSSALEKMREWELAQQQRESKQ